MSEKQEFKVGDKIVITKGTGGFLDLYYSPGCVGVIVYQDDDGDFIADFNNQDNPPGSFLASQGVLNNGQWYIGQNLESQKEAYGMFKLYQDHH